MMSSASTPAADPFLAPGRCVDSDHPAVRAFALEHAQASMPPRDIAVRLYYAVRDGFRYDPYFFDMSEQGLKASHVIANGRGLRAQGCLAGSFCPCAGCAGPARLCRRAQPPDQPAASEMMQTDVFTFHGFAELLIDGHWVKATPAFNLGLCEKAGVKPLEFDGRADSVFHEFDAHGRRHMEYVRERGSFADVPRREMLAAFAELYPAFETWMRNAGAGDFEQEVSSGDAT